MFRSGCSVDPCFEGDLHAIAEVSRDLQRLFGWNGRLLVQRRLTRYSGRPYDCLMQLILFSLGGSWRAVLHDAALWTEFALPTSRLRLSDAPQHH